MWTNSYIDRQTDFLHCFHCMLGTSLLGGRKGIQCLKCWAIWFVLYINWFFKQIYFFAKIELLICQLFCLLDLASGKNKPTALLLTQSVIQPHEHNVELLSTSTKHHHRSFMHAITCYLTQCAGPTSVHFICGVITIFIFRGWRPSPIFTFLPLLSFPRLLSRSRPHSCLFPVHSPLRPLPLPQI